MSPTARPFPGLRIRNQGLRSATPLLYLHGATSNGDVWLALSRLLAARHPEREGYLPDLPGHGKTPGLPQTRLSAYLPHLLHLLDSFALERVIVVGHSMGGALAQLMAWKHPDRVAGLVLLSCGARFGSGGDMLRTLAQEGGFSQALAHLQGRAFGPQFPENLRQQVMAGLRQTGASVMAADLRACADFDSREWVGTLRQPIRVISGDADALVRPEQVLELAGFFGVDPIFVPGAGHLLPLEAPGIVAGEVGKFIRIL